MVNTQKQPPPKPLGLEDGLHLARSFLRGWVQAGEYALAPGLDALEEGSHPWDALDALDASLGFPLFGDLLSCCLARGTWRSLAEAEESLLGAFQRGSLANLNRGGATPHPSLLLATFFERVRLHSPLHPFSALSEALCALEERPLALNHFLRRQLVQKEVTLRGDTAEWGQHALCRGALQRQSLLGRLALQLESHARLLWRLAEDALLADALDDWGKMGRGLAMAVTSSRGKREGGRQAGVEKLRASLSQTPHWTGITPRPQWWVGWHTPLGALKLQCEGLSPNSHGWEDLSAANRSQAYAVARQLLAQGVRLRDAQHMAEQLSLYADTHSVPVGDILEDEILKISPRVSRDDLRAAQFAARTEDPHYAQSLAHRRWVAGVFGLNPDAGEFPEGPSRP